jgi:hypothetical protein
MYVVELNGSFKQCLLFGKFATVATMMAIRRLLTKVIGAVFAGELFR